MAVYMREQEGSKSASAFVLHTYTIQLYGYSEQSLLIQSYVTSPSGSVSPRGWGGDRACGDRRNALPL